MPASSVALCFGYTSLCPSLSNPFQSIHCHRASDSNETTIRIGVLPVKVRPEACGGGWSWNQVTRKDHDGLLHSASHQDPVYFEALLECRGPNSVADDRYEISDRKSAANNNTLGLEGPESNILTNIYDEKTSRGFVLVDNISNQLPTPKICQAALLHMKKEQAKHLVKQDPDQERESHDLEELDEMKAGSWGKLDGAQDDVQSTDNITHVDDPTIQSYAFISKKGRKLRLSKFLGGKCCNALSPNKQIILSDLKHGTAPVMHQVSIEFDCILPEKKHVCESEFSDDVHRGLAASDSHQSSVRRTIPALSLKSVNSHSPDGPRSLPGKSKGRAFDMDIEVLRKSRGCVSDRSERRSECRSWPSLESGAKKSGAINAGSSVRNVLQDPLPFMAGGTFEIHSRVRQSAGGNNKVCSMDGWVRYQAALQTSGAVSSRTSTSLAWGKKQQIGAASVLQRPRPEITRQQPILRVPSKLPSISGLGIFVEQTDRAAKSGKE